MEKKRKLPARAAARAEHASKKRTVTPPDTRSETPAAVADHEPSPMVEEPPVPLPKSVQAGKPLPTVETAQPDDLPGSDYQSVQESGVLAESLSRSRQKWISEGIFERYWTKPSKRRGIVEDNPPKESMTKLGSVTITVEPHVFEAVMYAVKDPKPNPPQAAGAAPTRPVIQYGPPNGVMPPPVPPHAPTTPAPVTPAPVAASSTASPASTPAPPQSRGQGAASVQPMPAPASTPLPAQPQASAQTPTTTPIPQPQPQPEFKSESEPRGLMQLSTQPQPSQGPQTSQPPPSQVPSRPSSSAASAPVPAAKPIPSPRGMESVLSPSPASPAVPPPAPSAPHSSVASVNHPSAPAPNAPISHPTPNGAPASGTPGKPAPGTDPIILSLAEKAGENPQLRDLMKKVAQGDATKAELERFQAIIDAITAESKRKGTPLGPSADRLLVDGRTVRYFADEVRAILEIVLSSNPKQTSVDLRPPPGSDPLVVLLVKTALDDAKTRDMVRRIAGNTPMFSDATDLKSLLDRLKSKIVKEKERPPPPPQPATSTTATSSMAARPGAVPQSQNSASPAAASASQPSTAAAAAAPNHQQNPSQQALRSKGPPPPPPKPDISAIVLEFAGGNGDRYLFPKFSVLESVPVATGQQVIASFLIVLKGSAAEYPATDPALDYYQPVTIRLYAHSGRHLDNLAKVVAPPEEVRRYMDDVMDGMTRAEYILLAMRLPRGEGTGEDGTTVGEQPPNNQREKERERERDKDRDKDKDNHKDRDREVERESHLSGSAASKQSGAIQFVHSTPQVLWGGTKPTEPDMRGLAPRSKMYKILDADEQYQSLISSVSRREMAEGRDYDR